ncbi:hypothetical protein CYY_006957 [Polysphondylium violaceum]|uniref:Uncharacterized protein n=1 Tax=Polysphondylium violaceum TaxID=133409 RepID=A0A8J4PPV2_9MYCE|nr:hypothetical protein CYY_006957 [Polysphondylium violaceum]
MNKFNKIFRKSVQISPSDLNNLQQQQQQQQQPYGSGLNNSTGNLGSTSGASASKPPHPVTLSSSNSSPNLIHNNSNNNNNNSPRGGGSYINHSASSSSSIAGSVSNSQSNLYGQHQSLPLIDFDVIFGSFVKDGDTVKNYFLVHSVLSRKGPTSTSSGNLLSPNQQQQQPHMKSMLPFYKKNSFACFLVICKRSLLVIDATTYPFSVSKRIPYGDIKEILFDTSEVGFFSIELNSPSSSQQQKNDRSNSNGSNRSNSNGSQQQLQKIDTNNIYYFTTGCEKKEILDQVSLTLDEAMRDNNNLVVKKSDIFGSVDQSYKKDLKQKVNELLDDISLYGFTDQDLWEGNADLKYWVSKIKDNVILNNDERFVIDFILPQLALETIGSLKKNFRVPNNISIREITHFLCSKLQIPDHTLYTLATIKGGELNQDDILADYGVGSFFDNWQLCLVEIGKSRKAGLFNVEVHFPETHEFQGRYHRILELDGYLCASKLMLYIGQQMDIKKAHLYAIKLEILSNSSGMLSVTSSKILEDTDYLTTHGLGSKFLKCRLKLMPKKFPKASKDKQKNMSITLSIIDDIVDNAWGIYNERKAVKSQVLCEAIVNSIIDNVYLECKRASTLTQRIASLSAVGRAAMYKLLTQKEQEDINFFKVDGQKKTANEAKDLINSLTPLTGPSMDLTLEEEKTGLQVRVPPPPPPPILGFKNFKPKKETTSSSSSSHSSSGGGMVRASMAPGASIDMNQILGMRGKLRATTKKEDGDQSTAAATGGEKDKKIIHFTLRNTKDIKPASSLNSSASNAAAAKETNELMLKLQKRHAAVNAIMTDAEDLGDS